MSGEVASFWLDDDNLVIFERGGSGDAPSVYVVQTGDGRWEVDNEVAP